MKTKHPLYSLLNPIIESLDYDLVRILTTGQANPTLQIMIERKDRTPITVEDCAKISRGVSDVLDEKDPIENQYTLEVSSPGLDRPLTTLEQFARFTGFEAKIETGVEVMGRKRFKGKILSVDDKNIALNMDNVEYSIPFSEMNKAKLILTDELIKACEDNTNEEE